MRRRKFRGKVDLSGPRAAQCPKCGGPLYPTGKHMRVPVSAEVTVAPHLPIAGKKQWEYENELRCRTCGHKWGDKQISMLLSIQ